jgi:poly [ADP-ribose] polymerase
MSKVQQAVSKGVLIDQHCNYPGGELCGTGKDIYSCTLNQTDLKTNKNKFYIMQALKSGTTYYFFTRYGRIGEVGVINHATCSSESSVISAFTKQFKSKTGNNWSDRENFVKKTGKYHMADISYDDIPDEDSEEEDEDKTVKSKLEPGVFEFISLISDQKIMNKTMIELDIDTKKMPLGKIRPTQIQKAYGILNEISDVLDAIENGTTSDSSDDDTDDSAYDDSDAGESNEDKLMDLSSAFYTLIPFSSGRRSPPVIDSQDMLSKKVDLLNDLSNMVVGSKIVEKSKDDNTNKIDQIYDSLKTDISVLDKKDPMYKLLEDYAMNSKAPTHYFNYQVLDIYEIDRKGEKTRYDKFCKKHDIGEATLLFHGTRLVNTIGILTNGLMCDPSKIGIKVCVTGKMFGAGLYWASSSSKSIQYTSYQSSDGIALMFVGEIALGKKYVQYNANYNLNAKTLPNGYHSCHGHGSSGFEQEKYKDVFDLTGNKELKGVKIPTGKLEKYKNQKNCSLLYDEHIVYNDEQVNLKYIIKFKVK